MGPDGILQELGDLLNVCKMEQLQSEVDVMVEVKWLAAQQQQDDVCDVTVSQLVGAVAASGGGSPWDMLPLTCQDIAKATREDPVYGKLFRAVRAGAMDSKDKDLSKFAGVFDQLYIEEEVLFYGSRVVIPTRQQHRMLDGRYHHPG